MTKSDGVTTTTPGSVLRYTLGYANVGDQDATGAVLTETVPAGTSFNAAASTAGWVETAPGSGVYRFALGALPAGASGSVVFAVTVATPAAAGRGTIANTASVADDGANGPDPTPGDNTGTDTDTLDAAPDLRVSKTDGLTEARPGDTLTYTLTVANAGNQDATGVTLIDALPAHVTFLAASDGGAFANGAVTWTISGLAAGATVTRTVTVRVNAAVPAGVSALVNTASVADDGSNGPDPTPGDNTDADTDTLNATPDLRVSKTDGVTAVTPGSTLVYTLTYANVGTQDATGVVLTEALPAGTTFDAAASSAGWAETLPGSGVYRLTLGNLAAGGSGMTAFAVTVVSPAAAGLAQVTNTAMIADDGTNGADPTPGDNTGTDTDTLNATPDLVVAKSDGVAVVTAGATLTYTVTVRNVGTQGAAGVLLTDTLPANVSFVSASGGGSHSNGVVTWNVGGLAGGASATITVTVRVNAAVPAGVASLTNSATAADDGANGADPTPGDNTGTDTDTLDAAPDLRVTKTDGVGAVRPGDTLTYVITVTNAGDQDATGLVLTDTLPGVATFVGASDGGSHINGVVTWAVGDLPAGATVTRTVTVRVADTVPAGVDVVTNAAAAADDGTNGPDRDPGDNTGTDTDTLDAAPDLVLGKTDGRTVVIPGTSVVYTLSYRNAGTQDATEVVLEEALPAGTTFDPAASSPGWVGRGNGVYTLAVGPLAAGAAGTVRFAVTVNTPAPAGQAQVVNTAQVRDDGSNGLDPNPGDNAATDADELNRLPVAVNDTITADEDRPVLVPAGTLLGNDDQGDAPAVVVAVSPTSARGGTVVLGPGGVTYTPPANFSGTDTFTYTIRDRNGDESTATVQVTVVPSVRAASIGDRVWLDFDADGAQDADEPGLAGVALTLTRAGRDGDFATAADNTVFTAVTGPGGAYSFGNLPDGLYRLEVAGGLPAGAAATADADGGADGRVVFALGTGETRADLDFGFRGQSHLAGHVFRDYQVNGLYEPGAPFPETGIAGVTVTLTGTDAAGNAVARTAVTGPDGSYRFDGLLAGTYTLTEAQPAAFTAPGGFYDGLDRAGAAGGTAGDDVVRDVPLGTGAAGDGYTFGENPPADPFGYVWVDRNHNGRRDPGEPGIAGVAVTISGTAFAGTALARPLTAADVPGGLTAVTDADGRWEFLVIPPGLYAIAEAQPAGYVDGPESNADPSPPFTVAVGNDVFANVELSPFPVREPFDFGEWLRPGAAGALPPIDFLPPPPPPDYEFGKRAFLGSSTPVVVPTTPVLPTAPGVGGFDTPALRAAAYTVVAEDAGGGWVRVFDFAAGVERFRFRPYGDFAGGVRAATGDLTGDGIPDIITVPGPGGGPVVRVFDGDTGAEVATILAFEPGFRGGLQVAVGDFTGDWVADLAVTPDAGGGPVVRVLDGRTLAPVAHFFALDSEFRGGLRVATGDLNADGAADLLVTAGTGGGPRVAGYDGRSLATGPARLFGDFFGFAPDLRNGFWVTTGDADGDGFADVVLGAGADGAPRVAVYSGRALAAGAGPAELSTFFAGDPGERSGARVATVDVNGDGRDELVAACGPGPGRWCASTTS